MNTYHFAVFSGRFLKRGHLHGFARGQIITHAFLIKLPASKIFSNVKEQVFSQYKT
ncbi:MAG: hypothetical protein LUO95_04145 [Methylococcaceae bacterium]|nr:hypothetical protein [Methylococcaceae bacterium]MDD1616163.1 hypothetical protein [Methylococcaceae bacterium]OYV18444.1 MAG: hypothetical protein CG439_1286 [Methylococcaceae bacterium NSP1-2]